MRRFEVPLEKFHPSFSGEGLMDEKRTKETLVTVLRFLDKTIIPSMDEFEKNCPSRNEIKSRELRTGEDAQFFLFTVDSLTIFIGGARAHVTNYLKKACNSLSSSDYQYVSEQVLTRFEKRATSLMALAAVASAKLDLFIQSSQTSNPFPNETDSISHAVERAGRKRRMPVDKLMGQ